MEIATNAFTEENFRMVPCNHCCRFRVLPEGDIQESLAAAEGS